MTPLASSVDELRPLTELCRMGQLFEVQEWIRQGKPIALAEGVVSRSKHRHPLLVALSSGFHSMVELLLQAGSPTSHRGNSALAFAIEMGRPDLAKLLLKHGADASQVPMWSVIDRGCRLDVIDMLLAAGKNLVDDRPIAWGLIHCIRPTLGLLKRHVAEHPELMRQVDLALRYHAKQGNQKWVALTLWAGADPLARGPDDLDREEDGDYPGKNAVELAAFYDQFEVLQQKPMLRAIEACVADTEVFLSVCSTGNSRVLDLFLKRGHSPARLPDRGTQAIENVVSAMAMQPLFDRIRYGGYDNKEPADTSGARDRMALLHMLVANGARWMPEDKQAIGHIRRSLLKLVPAFAMEFAWLMKQYGAARQADVRDLLGAPSMRRHLAGERTSLDRILAGIPEEVSPSRTAPVETRPTQGNPASQEPEATCDDGEAP